MDELQNIPATSIIAQGIYLVGIILAFIVNFKKLRGVNKKDIEDLENQRKIDKKELTTSIEKLGSKIEIVAYTVQDLTVENELAKTKKENESSLYNTLTKTAFVFTQTVLDPEQDTNLIQVLNHIRNKVINFSTEYLNSPFRKDEDVDDLKKYLQMETESIRNTIRFLADRLFKGEVFYKNTKFIYSNFINEYTDNDSVIKALVFRLEENGLSDQQKYISVFKKFLLTIFQNQVKANKKWNKLMASVQQST